MDNFAEILSKHIIATEVITGKKIQRGANNGLWEHFHTMNNAKWKRFFKDTRIFVKPYSHMAQAKNIKAMIAKLEQIQTDLEDTYDDVLTPHPKSARSTGRPINEHQFDLWKTVFSVRDFYEYLDRGEYRKSLT